MKNPSESNFHAGEHSLQSRLGVAEPMAEISLKVIRDYMPEQHRDFFTSLPFMVVALADRAGYPIPSMVTGPNGFIQSPDEQKLWVQTQPLFSESLDIPTQQGAKIGLLGIELGTRRRNRMNGVVGRIDSKGFEIIVDQSFGNCPQYIQTRSIQPNNNYQKSEVNIAQLDGLNSRAKSIIASADTFFIASRTDVFSDDPKSGIDVSHRGGKPGFLRLSENGRLCFPDFRGNRFFNTLGNIQLDDRIGLLLIDFKNKDMLFISGHAKVDWNPDEIARVKGAERIIEIIPEKIFLASNALPFDSGFEEYSPVLQRTGNWDS